MPHSERAAELKVVIALCDTWFSLYPGSHHVVLAWQGLPTTYHRLSTADMAALHRADIRHSLIPAGPGDILIFKKFTVHTSPAVKAGDGTRFTTYARFQLSKRR